MKAHPGPPEWTLHEATLAFEILSKAIEGYESEPFELPHPLPERVDQWLRSIPGITYDRDRNVVSISHKNYPLSRIVLDGINWLFEVDNPAESTAQLSVPKKVKAIFLPFLAATDAYRTKEVVNKLIENAALYEKARNVYIPPFVALLLAFRDALSSRGLYAKDEVASVLAEDYPSDLESYLEPLTLTQRKIFNKLRVHGVLSGERLLREGVSQTDLFSSIDEMAQSLGMPVSLYQEDPAILTFKAPTIRAWQFDDAIEFVLHPRFADVRELPRTLSCASLLGLVRDHSKIYMEEVETNIVSLRSSDLDIESHLDTYHLPIERPVYAGEVYWGLHKIPEFIKLLPKIGRAQFLSGMVKFCLRNLRDQFLGQGFVAFPCVSKDTAVDLYKMLRQDFSVLCKRPSPEIVAIYGEGLLELARVVRVEDVERQLLLSVAEREQGRITTIRDRRSIAKLVGELLLGGPRTAREIGDELLLDDVVLEPLLHGMAKKNAITLQSDGAFRFGLDEGDLYQFINDDQIHRAMRTAL